MDINAAAAQAQSTIDNYLDARRSSHYRARVTRSFADPVDTVTHYSALLDGGRFGEAWRIWQGDGLASGLTERRFAQRYARLSRIRIDANQAAAKIRDDVMVVPVVLRATLASGRTVAIAGIVHLRRDPAGRWRIAAATI